MQDLMNLKYSQWPLKVLSISEMKAIEKRCSTELKLGQADEVSLASRSVRVGVGFIWLWQMSLTYLTQQILT